MPVSPDESEMFAKWVETVLRFQKVGQFSPLIRWEYHQDLIEPTVGMDEWFGVDCL